MSDKTEKKPSGVGNRLSSITAALSGGGVAVGVPTIGMSAKRPKPGATDAPSAPLALASFSADYKQLERQVDELTAREGQPITVKIADLVDCKFHIGPLVESRVAALVKNLAVNKLNSPVVIRRLADGTLEVVAGRHRIEAYRRLGRSEIEAVIKDYSDVEVIALVFFDNLLAPVTPDYFKYLGFRQLRDELQLTHEGMAEKSGVSKSQVGRYMAFEKLPDAALAIIEANAEMFGSNLAAKLASLAGEYADQIPRACELIVAGQLEQDGAADWIRDNVQGRAPGAVRRAAPVKTEIAFPGGKRYAVIAVKGKRLAITLQDPDEASFIEAIVKKALEDRAAAKSKTKAKPR
ncbi:ParB family chromosome partitioning protein [Roseateles asaccharophilus]|uniref:ParB/RepB/Spo0J family partition protein n=1 Tax=Roseateles asaccharophilus TaxID=582607 RepID=UPI003839CF04